MVGKLTDVAPYRRKVQCGVSPHDRVDELNEAGEGRPDHVNARAGVGRLEVPWQRNEGHDEAEEGEDRQEGVCGIGMHNGESEREQAQVRGSESHSIFLNRAEAACGRRGQRPSPTNNGIGTVTWPHLL